jgi:hypothetical protein
MVKPCYVPIFVEKTDHFGHSESPQTICQVTPSPRTFGKLLTCAARSGEGRWQQRLMQVAPEVRRGG